MTPRMKDKKRKIESNIKYWKIWYIKRNMINIVYIYKHLGTDVCYREEKTHGKCETFIREIG